MPQVIVRVAMDQFYYALNYNARRRPEIAASCTRAEDICIMTSNEFHRRNPNKVVVGKATNRQEWAAKVENYYSKVCHVRVATEGNDKRGGFVVIDGELVGFHHVDKGKGDWLLAEAVSLGANRLDCFDIPHLLDLYYRHGFREVLREPNHKKGAPDVVWMRRDV